MNLIQQRAMDMYDMPMEIARETEEGTLMIRGSWRRGVFGWEITLSGTYIAWDENPYRISRQLAEGEFDALLPKSAYDLNIAENPKHWHRQTNA